ncbi:hypothetical protein HTX81_08525 [Pseudomonas lini]|uniref:hypothetical protein n=1 Tax=Pseudomonas lini TaxID=163011 RepID=UPI001571EB34|nr:hypothetical protein [Pseudomonas lini]NSX08618.1 hypothetical protein [Pseudomonas lini]
MKKWMTVFTLSALSAGCANWSGKPNPEIVGANGENRLIVQSGLFTSCGHFDNSLVGQENALVATVAALAIKKVAEAGVEALASAIDDAAKKRNDAFDKSGKSAGWLYKGSTIPAVARRCLVIVAGAKKVNADPCQYQDSSWVKDQKKNSCDVSPITEALKDWGIDKPAMYAEILLYAPEPSAPNYILPKLVYSYYPQPLSSHAAKDLEKAIVTVKAESPSGGGSVFSIVYQNGELAPGKGMKLSATPEALRSAEDSGAWLILPGDLAPSPAKGNGGALNIVTQIIETPEPNKIIALANEIMKETKPTFVEAADAKLSYALLSSARQEQRATEAEANETRDSSAIAACKELDSNVQAAKVSKKSMLDEPGNDSLVIAYRESCLSAQSSNRKAKDAWGESSYKAPAVCFSSKIQSDLAAACP